MNDAVLSAAKILAAAGIDSARLDARLLWAHAQENHAPDQFEMLLFILAG